MTAQQQRFLLFGLSSTRTIAAPVVVFRKQGNQLGHDDVTFLLSRRQAYFSGAQLPADGLYTQ